MTNNLGLCVVTCLNCIGGSLWQNWCAANSHGSSSQARKHLLVTMTLNQVTSPADTSTLRVHVHESHADIGMNAQFATRKVMANINVGRKMAKKNDLDNSIICY